jgi:predicted phage replisome organizer
VADVKWIKITTDIFDDEKILLIESLPDAYAIITVWFKLLCLAGKQNNSGVFMMGRIPYTDKMLATIFRMKESSVTMALQTFEQFGMIEIVDGVITIPNWEKHQNLDKLEQAREQTRQRVARHRAKQKQLAECNAPCNANVTQTEEDKEEEKDIDKDIDKENKRTDFQSVVDLFHTICVSFPKVRSLSDARKKAIKARLNTYTMDDFKTVFENAEASSFLKGSNDRNWSANFDWLIADKNIAKVLEGNYADKDRRKENVPEWFGQRQLDDDEKRAIQQMLSDDQMQEAERLRKQFESWSQ